MYHIFDDFLRKPTWSTSHPSDVGNFRAALSDVIGHPDFDPDEMGRYFQQHGADDIWKGSNHGERISAMVKEAKDKLRRRRAK
ncbi:hypothetical protein [Asticcacaulis sp. YBE204]|uniref:hypothetical protein n=1 Tax=Asticcacaulis sp. YBE204 TaxID=1282363 RepID=UPI0012DC16C5|nr:hypothetical protein [Asticcacaulis sp. YBE204]